MISKFICFFSIIISLRLPFFSAIFPYVVFFSTKKNIFFIVYLEEAYFSFSKSSYSNRDGGKTTHSILENNEHLRTENRQNACFILSADTKCNMLNGDTHTPKKKNNQLIFSIVQKNFSSKNI